MKIGVIKNIFLSAVICILLIPVCALAVDQQGAVTIALLTEANIEGVRYSLGDIADIQSEDIGTVSRLSKIVIDELPRVGYSMLKTGKSIRHWLENKGHLSGLNVQWLGSNTVRLKTVSRSIKRSELQSQAFNYLSNMLGDKYTDFNINYSADYSSLELPVGTLDIKVSSAGKIKTKTCVWVDVFVDDMHAHTECTWMNVRVFNDVLVAARDVGKNSRMTRKNVFVMKKDVSEAGDYIHELSDLTQYRFTKDIYEGEIITSSDVGYIPEVEKGELVTVHSVSGRIRLKTQAVAMSDGVIDQRIWVKNVRHGDMYAVTVKEDGEVEANGH